MKESWPMQIATSNPMESLREWDEICRAFGCSDDQVRELYSAPCPEAAPATESYEDVMAALRRQTDQQQASPGFHTSETQN
jgi:hypothetical protein